MVTQNDTRQLVRIGVLQNLDRVVAQLGLDVEKELATLGFNGAMLKDGDLLISSATVGQLLEHFATVTGHPDFALQLAATQDLSLLGAQGLFMQTSTTLGEALREVSRYNHLHAQPASWILRDEEGYATFDFYLNPDGLSPEQRRLCVELAVAHACIVVRLLSSGQVKPERVRLHCERPDDLQHYRRVFAAPTEFGADTDGVVLPCGALQLPLSGSNPSLHETMRQQFDAEGPPPSRVQEVRTILRSLLPTGSYGLEFVAKYYACDKRTVQRYLRNEADTTFQALLDDVRFELVEQYLRDSRMTVSQLAYVAGFTDSSNFARAFRQRFGVTPRQWRANAIETAALSG